VSREIDWLRELADAASTLPQGHRPRPYWSQRNQLEAAAELPTLARTATRVRRVISELLTNHFFAQTLGYDCVDGNGNYGTSVEEELERRLGRTTIWDTKAADWSRDELFDVIEVFHDLAARPTRGWVHGYGGCGWHPSEFSRQSGQALYRWRINEILDGSGLELRLAEDGEDVGRLVRRTSEDLDRLVEDSLQAADADTNEVRHAVALFRSRDRTREDMRSAIVALHRILEGRRGLLKAELMSNDEAALFEIANRFDLRHRRPSERTDYRDDFLEWIFYWYLATIRLTDSLIADPPSPS
jgi:hypothetical protein